MKKSFLFTIVLVICIASISFAQNRKKVKGDLVGFEEVPAISTAGGGEFKAKISSDDTSVEYELTYGTLNGAVAQSHLHFGQQGVNGGITVFLCTNLANGDVTTQACPPAPATITGVITAADVSPDIPATQGARDQGMGTGEFAEFLAALRDGKIYVNVHSDLHPGGEIRSQLGGGRRSRESE